MTCRLRAGFWSPTKSNSAAWLVGDGVRPLEVRSAPCPTAFGGDEFLVVRVGAVAINHQDVEAQVAGNLFQKRVECPRVLGCDLAGDVVQVGERAIGGIRVGDRILALAVGGVTPSDNDLTPFSRRTEERAFQEFVLVRRHLACVIPDTITYEQACVFPLTMTIAASALFHRNYLELSPPTVPPREPDASSDVVIITASASSVGCHAVQLACAAGYWVYSTASPEDFETVKKLGARRVFDYRTRNLAAEILSAMQEDNRTIAGAVAIGIETVGTCRRVLRKYKGGNGLRDNNKFIAFTGSDMTEKNAMGPLSMVRRMGSAALRKKLNSLRSRVAGVQIKPIVVQDPSYQNPITRIVFQDFFPRALASGDIPLIPQPRVVGKGLEKIQEAFDVLRDGVSVEKVVVSMPYVALPPGRGALRAW